MLARIPFTIQRRIDIQNTKAEHAQKTNFLPHRKVQAIQFPERQNHHYNIKNHVDDGSRPSLSVDIVALIIVLAVPAQIRAFQRIALEDRDQNKHNKVGDVESDGDVGCNSKRLLRKDT